MTGTDYMFICIIAGFACFGIWVFTPHYRRTMAAVDAQEKSQAKAELDLDQLRHEQAQQFERERLALEAERERMRLELEAERARMEAELGVSLEKKPEVVYVEKPVYIERDSGGMSEGSKTAIKAGVAGAAGYAFGRKLL